MQRLLILGAGGFAVAVAEIAQAAGIQRVVGFLDDRHPEISTLLDLPILGRLDLAAPWTDHADVAVAAFGNPALRRRAAALIAARGLGWCTVIHPQAAIAPSARLGRGVIIMAGAIVGSRCVVEDGALLNAGVVLDHDVRIGQFASLAVGSGIGGGGRIDADTALEPGRFVMAGQRYPSPSADLPDA